MLGLLLGSFGRMLSGSLAAVGGIVMLCAFCSCRKWCNSCKFRDFPCVKRLLRFTGQDEFDDFDLMILVHEAAFEYKEAKLATIVRVTAGAHSVSTDANSNSIFQQPLHIKVDQGTEEIVVDLLDARSRSRVLANLKLATAEVLKTDSLQAEQTYLMEEMRKGIRNPTVKLTMVVDECVDKSRSNCKLAVDVDILVRQQLRKVREEGKELDKDLSEVEVLYQAGTGPLLKFEGLGKTSKVFVAVNGPPTSKRWTLGVWTDEGDRAALHHPMKEVDLLKVQSVQADPTRDKVFIINYFDKDKQHQQLVFQRIDRARDVWVEILSILVGKARDAKRNLKIASSRNNLTPGFQSSSAAGGKLSPRNTERGSSSIRSTGSDEVVSSSSRLSRLFSGRL